MLDSALIKTLIKERSELEPNDPKVYEYWERMTELLSVSIVETILFFNTCSEQEVYWLSEIFEDIAYKVNSMEFIQCLKRLDKKYPDLDLSYDIKIAEEFMEE